MQIQKIRKERFRTLRLLLFAIILGALVGYAVLQSKTVDDRTTKIAEAKTLLHLTNSFVSVYSQHTQSTQQDQFPVPASFQANAAQQFNEMQSGESQPIVSMVGLAGREISTPPVDQTLADRLETMASNRNFSQYSTEFDNDKDKFLRTVFPTIANQDSCVDCHNQLQPNGPTWVKGDLMGAYVVDRPIGAARHSIFQYSLLVGVLAGFVTLLAGALHAYSRRLKLQAIKLRLLADTDPLTGCLNRRAFGSAFEQNSIHKVGGAILVLDLDFFKRINDTYGHSIGDQVLIHFVDLVKTQIRDDDIFARIGGEEFAILLSDIQSKETRGTAQRICRAINHTSFRSDDVVIHYTVSIGAVKIHADSPQRLGTLLNVADQFLYRAKELGRNQVFPASL